LSNEDTKKFLADYLQAFTTWLENNSGE